MKIKLFLLCFLFGVISCTPRISYLGDSYGRTTKVDVYYDQGDIDREYKVIGLARNEGDDLERDDLQSIKTEMIKKAKEVGADAILFISVAENRDGQDFDPNKIVEAKFLKYEI